MMSRPVVLTLVLLFLFSMASARPKPSSAADPTAQKATVEVDVGSVGAEEECKGITEEECLQRRTLLAHTDYIYTNRNNKP